MDRTRFFEARRRVLSEEVSEGGIGTLGEKLLHKVLKYYFEPCEEHHERELLGSVADVFDGERVVEIQTRAFNKLLPKLRKFLPHYPVTVVYPIVRVRVLHWLDRETGELTPPRKSTKRGKYSDALPELSAIRELIPNENLTVKLVYLDSEEYRYLDGWDKSRKHGATKLQLIPTDIIAIEELASRDDYRSLLPEGLPEQFCAEELYRVLGMRGRRAYFSLNLLRELGIIKQTGTRGRAYIYEINKEV